MPEENRIGKVSKSDPRTVARLLAVQYLFNEKFLSDLNISIGKYEPNTILGVIDEEKFDNRLYETLVEGVIQNDKELSDMIASYAKSWPLDQINPVDLCILKVGIYEAFIHKITPPKVVINESIEIAKVLSSESGAKFINGVLGKIFDEHE